MRAHRDRPPPPSGHARPHRGPAPHLRGQLCGHLSHALTRAREREDVSLASPWRRSRSLWRLRSRAGRPRGASRRSRSSDRVSGRGAHASGHGARLSSAYYWSIGRTPPSSSRRDRRGVEGVLVPRDLARRRRRTAHVRKRGLAARRHVGRRENERALGLADVHTEALKEPHWVRGAETAEDPRARSPRDCRHCPRR